MKVIRNFEKLIFFGLFVMFSAYLAAQDNPLEKYRRKNRIVIAFLSASSESEFSKITAVYDEQFKERDVLIFTCVLPEKSMSAGAGPGKSKCEILRSLYDITVNEDTFILIGKDGAEKLRQKGKADLKEIINLIDSMPMRIREKEKNE